MMKPDYLYFLKPWIHIYKRLVRPVPLKLR